MAEKETWYREQYPSPDHSQWRRSELEIPWQSTLGTESNLEGVHLDIFGNIMILNVPHLSDISVQFMHGFPGHLIPYHHHGILSDKITVTAHISNQAMQSLLTGD